MNNVNNINNINNISNNQNFAWKLVFNELSLTSKLPLKVLSDQHVLQLKGIFLFYDDDRDGYITVPQLIEALKLLGFVVREKLILKFVVNSNQIRKYHPAPPPIHHPAPPPIHHPSPPNSVGNSNTNVVTTSHSNSDHLSTYANHKNYYTNTINTHLQFKTSFHTFVSTISKEIKQLKELEIDLSSLFLYMVDSGSHRNERSNNDSNNPSHSNSNSYSKTNSHSIYLSKRDLRHLLVDVITPFSMSPTEFNKFIKMLKFLPNSDSITVFELKRQILFGFDINL